MKRHARDEIKALIKALCLVFLIAGNAVVPACAGEESAASGSSALPARFDARELGKAPLIRSQGELGSCWAVTAASALEAAMLPGERMVFSADHMIRRNGFVMPDDYGGDNKMIMAYLAGWYGPVLEEEDPYGDGVSTGGLLPVVHVQDIRFMEGEDINTFKTHIMKYGPVQTSLHMDKKLVSSELPYYDEAFFAYYYPEEAPVTHDVLLLGWDDDFPAERFKSDPGRDGAFICQNTWGEDFGDNGVFYVSYEDPNIASGGLAYLSVAPAGDGERIYQTDRCGWQGRQGYRESSCFFANVYTAVNAGELCAAGFYTTGRKNAYELFVVRDFEDESSFDKREKMAEGMIEGAGFYTIRFPAGCALEEGERFAVVVRLETEGSTLPVAVEMERPGHTLAFSTEGREGYLSLYGGLWENTERVYGTNVCLKAYVDEDR